MAVRFARWALGVGLGATVLGLVVFPWVQSAGDKTGVAGMPIQVAPPSTVPRTATASLAPVPVQSDPGTFAPAVPKSMPPTASAPGFLLGQASPDAPVAVSHVRSDSLPSPGFEASTAPDTQTQ